MKLKELLFLAAITFSVNLYAQTTAIPDVNFEQALIDLGIENGTPDGVVLTSKIDTITSLDVHGLNISDMTGIEDFVSLKTFWLYSNNLTAIDISNNTALTLFVPADNNLTSLDLSNNILLEALKCHGNNLTSLDLSNNVNLHDLIAQGNDLVCLNVKNGNNINLWPFNAIDNPNLTCIEVDDATWSDATWLYIDPQSSFSTDCNNACSVVGISELNNAPKELLKIVDLMGRETVYNSNAVLIYIYSDGTTERGFKLND